MVLFMNIVSLRAQVEKIDACVAKSACVTERVACVAKRVACVAERACVAKHVNCVAHVVDYEPDKSINKADLIEGLLSSHEHCTLCSSNKGYDILSSLDTLKSQAVDWVKFKQSIEQHT